MSDSRALLLALVAMRTTHLLLLAKHNRRSLRKGGARLWAELKKLPEGAFDSLLALEELDLGDVGLQEVDADVFDKLTSLKIL